MNKGDSIRFFWFILVFCLISCASPSVVSQDISVDINIKQGNNIEKRVCGVRVGCGRIDPLSCVHVMHSIVQNHMKAAAFFIQNGAERGQIVTEFLNALCKLKDIEAELNGLRVNNFTEWKSMYDSGLVTQLKMLIVAISVEIFSPHKVEDQQIPNAI
jgi:hypothetical protein